MGAIHPARRICINQRIERVFNGGDMNTWKPADRTDIRETWLKYWPESNRDEVYNRIRRQVERGDTLPPPPVVQIHYGRKGK